MKKTKEYIRCIYYHVKYKEQTIGELMISGERYHLVINYQEKNDSTLTSGYEEIMENALKEAVKLAKEWGYARIIFRNPIYQFERGSESEQAIKNFFNKHLKKLEELAPIYSILELEGELSKQDYVLDIEENIVQKFCSFYQTAMNIIKEKGKKEPTLTIDSKKTVYLNISHTIYFEGTRENLSFHFKQSDFLLRFGKEEFSFSDENYNEDNWKETFHTFFEKKYKEQRLKTVFKPTRNYIRSGINLLHISNDKLEEKLLEFYDFRELEDFFAVAIKNKCISATQEEFLHEGKVMFITIQEHIFVFDTKDKEQTIHHFALSEKEKALYRFIEIVEKNNKNC